MGFQGFFLVFVGGGMGSACRHGVNLLAARWLGGGYPWGTFVINVLGALAMGVVVELFALKTSLPPSARLLLTTGVIGGFTTFSTYVLEIGLLLERGDAPAALAYALSSLVVGLLALWAGMGLVRLLLP